MHHNILPDDNEHGGFLESMDKSELIHALKQFPQLEGARVMVHSSLSSFGYVEGGALTVIEALQAAITPHGTLMMPSFNHGAAFEPGAAGYYDPLETPTINGAVPDLFWRLPGVQRSLHPTHAFAAWGRDNSRYVQNHHRTLTMGPDSPLGLLCRDGGFALLLGVGYASNTFQHVVEVSTGAPCLGLRTQVYPVRLPGDRIVQARAWSWRQADCPLTDRSLYAGAMHSLGLQQTAILGSCRATFFRLQDCYSVIARLLRDGKDGIPGCRGCPIRPSQDPHTVISDWDSQNQCLLPDSTAWTYP